MILYEDRAILVVDKPAGLLTMGTDAEKTRTAYFFLTDYARKGYSKSRERIFIVHHCYRRIRQTLYPLLGRTERTCRRPEAASSAQRFEF